MSGVNFLLRDEAFGGSATSVSGHGVVLALHIQQQLKSSRKLTDMLQNDQSTLVRDFSCMKPLHTLVQVRQSAWF